MEVVFTRLCWLLRIKPLPAPAVLDRSAPTNASKVLRLLGNPRWIELREVSPKWSSRSAQRRADKPGRHAHGAYLVPRPGFAKEILAVRGNNCADMKE